MSRWIRSVVVVVALLWAASAAAQTSVRYYFVPRVGTGTFDDPFRAKYTKNDELGAGWTVGPYQSMNYGLQNVFLVALNIDATQHNTLSSQPDVLAVPSPLSDNVSALAVTVIQSKLEAANLPSDWVNTGLTYRQCLSRLMRLIQFQQRFNTLFGDVFASGATLDTRINQLPLATRQALSNAANSLGADTSTVTGPTMLRAALRIVADQLFPNGISFGFGDVF